MSGICWTDKGEHRRGLWSMASESDKLLVQEIRSENPEAWQRLIDRYEGRLLAFARRRLSDRSQAEDIVQETFVGFLNSLPNYDQERDLQTYDCCPQTDRLPPQTRQTSTATYHGWSGIL
ncbi:MAG TPA: sigma-70 family RNA polymerase sigma factor [Gemmatales bacterium]|nr:sigma-70 family RNA polymerase sigma factor [Gemmatales bacterium]